MITRKLFSYRRVLSRQFSKSRCLNSLLIAWVFLAGLLCEHLIFHYGNIASSSTPSDSYSYSRRVVNAMEVSFDAYWYNCKGHDEYEPVTSQCVNWLGVGITELDSIDTLLIMGLTRQYNSVLKHENRFSGLRYDLVNRYSKNAKFTSVFEFGIRALGGLNSAYELSGDSIWLKRAVEVADLILPAFTSTQSGCPVGDIVLGTNRTRHYKFMWGNNAGTADAGSLQLEMRTLSRLSGDNKYAIVADRCAESMRAALPKNRVVSAMFDVAKSEFGEGSQRISSSVDSYIEMLLKIWIASDRSDKDSHFKDAFVQQADLVLRELTREENGSTILSEKGRWSTKPEASMEHLSCFFPGVLALASMYGVGDKEKDKRYLEWAEKLANTCYLFSRSNSEGLAPEVAFVSPGGSIEVATATCILRPEIVESLFVLYKVTGGEKYRAMGRSMWDSIEKSAMLSNGRLAPVIHLGRYNSKHSGKLESFVLAETLKYFFLLFREENEQGRDIDLREMVFTTEAHPVLITN